MSRIRIFSGHFGSGKTEISINYALNLSRNNKKVVVVDLDIVNPYFCIREIKNIMEKKGIKVISSNNDYVNAELMVVPPDVISIFNNENIDVIIDVGGDDTGAVVLGQYNEYFKKESYEMYFVINNNRPFTSDCLSTKEYINCIQEASRLKVTHLISNTNLSYETQLQDILKGDKIVQEVSNELKIPYKYTVCKREFQEQLKGKVKGEVLPIDIYMKMF